MNQNDIYDSKKKISDIEEKLYLEIEKRENYTNEFEQRMIIIEQQLRSQYALTTQALSDLQRSIAKFEEKIDSIERRRTNEKYIEDHCKQLQEKRMIHHFEERLRTDQESLINVFKDWREADKIAEERKYKNQEETELQRREEDRQMWLRVFPIN